jgi:chromosome segregation ATPase
MSALYNFVKVKMQDTLHRRKANSMPLAPVKSTTALSLSHETERLERLVMQRLGKLKAAMQASEAMVAQEARQAEKLATNLREDIAMLRAKLKDAEETIARKDLSRQEMEESFNTKIKFLGEEIQKKDGMLVIRDNELKDCRSKINDNVTRISDLELNIRKTKEETATNAKRAEDLAESNVAKITALEAHLKETEELARYQESSIQKLERELAVKAQEFDSIEKEKQELLTGRDSEINDLKSQLKRITSRISEMSSFLREAEALTRIESQDLKVPAQNDTTARVEEKMAAVQTEFATTHVAPVAVGEIVSPEIFQRIISELSEATNMMDALASLIVQRQVKALGESVDKFPTTRLSELLECLAKDISDEDRQIDFRQRCTENAQITLN